MLTYQLKRLADNTIFTVTQTPDWKDGVWDCGNIRYADPDKTLFEDATSGHALLAPIDFHNAFSVSERIKLKNNADPVVQELWKTFQLAMSTPGKMIDPDDAVVLGGLLYIAGGTSSPAPVIDPANKVLASTARIPQIQAGTPGGF